MSTKSEILKYIMHTPENTNPGIVESMLDGLEGSASGSAIGNTVNLSTDIVGELIGINGNFITTAGNYYTRITAEIGGTSGLALCVGGRNGYEVDFYLESENDLYSMTVNGTPVPFNSAQGKYLFASTPSHDPVNGQTYNVVITNKQV